MNSMISSCSYIKVTLFERILIGLSHLGKGLQGFKVQNANGRKLLELYSRDMAVGVRPPMSRTLYQHPSPSEHSAQSVMICSFECLLIKVCLSR